MIGFNLAVLVLFFAGMECVAWFTHKYVMHTFGWFLHEDHHLKGEGQVFEKNDSFFLIFATPAIVLMFFGMSEGLSQWYFWAGVGITLYGMAYFLVHDIFIHQRFKWFRNANSLYLTAIRRAHKMHHKHIGKEDGECFGMLFVPFKYFKEARELRKNV